MRPMTLLFCLALAGCAGANAAHDVVPSSASMAQAGPKSRAAQPSAAKDEWWKEGGVTREKVNAMCWMKYEKGHGDLPVDKRADLVNRCVAEALKEHPIR